MLTVSDIVKELVHVSAEVRWEAGEHLVQDASQGVDIGSFGGSLSCGLALDSGLHLTISGDR